MGKYTRLGKNTLFVFIGNAGGKLIGLFMLPFYTRWLSVEDYGITDIISVYVGFFLGLATCCIAESIFIFPKGQPFEKQKEYFSSGLFFSTTALTVTALLFFLVNQIFLFFGENNSFTDNSWLIFGMLVAVFLQSYVQQFARSIDKMKVYSVTGIILSGGTALFSFAFIPRWGVHGFVFAMICANVVSALYTFTYTKAFKYISFQAIEKSKCIEMLKYSIPLIPNGIMWWIVGALNRPLMAEYLGMHSVGIFGVANKFPGILSMVFSIFVTSWQISVLEEFGKEGYSQFFNKVFRYVVVGLIFVFILITLFSKLIVTIFAAPDFFEAWKYIPILTLGVLFSNISGLAGSNFSATKESKYFFYSSVWGAVSSILFNFILIPWIGIMGAGLSVLLSFIVMAVSRIAYGWKYVKIQDVEVYLIMFLICALLIVAMLNIENLLMLSAIVILLFMSFVSVNYSLKNDLINIYHSLKNRK